MKKILTGLTVACIVVASAGASAAVGGPESDKGCPAGSGGRYWATQWVLDLLAGFGIGEHIRENCIE